MTIGMTAVTRTIVTLLLLASALPAVAQTRPAKLDGDGQAYVTGTRGMAQASISVDGTFTGTISFQVLDAVGNTYAANCVAPNSTSEVTSTTAPGSWSCPVAGYTAIQAVMSGYSAGAARVFGDAAPNAGMRLAAGGGGSNAAASATASAVPAAASYTGINVAGTHRGWTGFAVGSHFAGSMAIVDAAGAQITSFGGGTQYTQDAALTVASTIGTMAVGRASAAVPTDVSADNDAVLPWYLRSGAMASQPTYAGILAVAGNGAAGTGVQRVTLASDSTGVVGLATGANTVGSMAAITTSVTPGTSAAHLGKAEDAVVATADTGVAMLAMAQATPTATAADGDYINPKTDATGRLWVNCGAGCSGGTQFAEDVAHTTGDLGTQLLAVRNDAGTTLAGTTGDYAPLSLDSSGALRVVGSSGTTQFAEDIAHTTGDATVFVGALRRDTTPTSSSGAAGDYSAINVDANGRLYTNTVLYDAAGAALTLNSDVIEDAAETSAVPGPMVLNVRRDTLASSAGTTGDNATFNSNSLGALYTQPTAGASGGADTHNVASAATTNSTSVKASAGTAYSITLINTTAVLYYLRLYNLATAPTCSSATGYVTTLPIPASATGAGVSVPLPVGMAFTTGIAYCITGGPTSTDNTNAAVGVYGFLSFR